MGEEVDIEIELLGPRERPEQSRPEKREARRGGEREPATGRLLESKVEFLEEVVGGARGLAEWIRVDAEEILHDWFYEYLERVFRDEGIDPSEVFKVVPGAADALEEVWDRIRVDAVNYVLNWFADYLERKYGLEGMADRFLLCWIGPEFTCNLDKRKLLSDFTEASALPFRYVMEDVIDEIIDIVLYLLAEAEREG